MSYRRTILMQFRWANNDVILMLFFDIISMDGKLTHFQLASIDVFLKDKKLWLF